jgi:hypothetical protein
MRWELPFRIRQVWQTFRPHPSRHITPKSSANLPGMNTSIGMPAISAVFLHKMAFNSSRMNRSTNFVPNQRRMNTCTNDSHVTIFRMNTCTKMGRGVPPFATTRPSEQISSAQRGLAVVTCVAHRRRSPRPPRPPRPPRTGAMTASYKPLRQPERTRMDWFGSPQ